MLAGSVGSGFGAEHLSQAGQLKASWPLLCSPFHSTGDECCVARVGYDKGQRESAAGYGDPLLAVSSINLKES